MPSVAPASDHDVIDVAALMRRAFDPRYGEAWNLAQLTGVLAMPGAELLIVRQRGQLLGFALTRTVLEDCELMLIAVEPGLRRAGIASALLQNILDRARAAGAHKLHLEVRQGNDATELYDRFGFEKVGARSRYYRGAEGEVFDAETYSRSLIE